MIPYDDLVVALASWRARRGLPVAQSAAAPIPRAAPPVAPPRSAARPASELHDVDDGALIEEAAYDASEDYVLPLGVEPAGEATAIGMAPEPVTDGLLVPKHGQRPGGR
jgi:hypothetical protein